MSGIKRWIEQVQEDIDAGVLSFEDIATKHNCDISDVELVWREMEMFDGWEASGHDEEDVDF